MIDHLHRVLADIGGSPESCSFVDETAEMSVLAVNGPNSRALLAPLVDGSLDNESFAPGTVQQIKVAGVDAVALRVSFAGELGWEFHIPNEGTVQLFDALMEAGKAYGMVPAGTSVLLNSLRTEKNFLHYGADVGMTETPFEVGAGFACKIKPEQPDFIGKAALVEKREAGVTKRLVAVKGADPDLSLWGHEEEVLYRNGELVGSMTSGCYSHFLDCPIGLAIIRGPPKVPVKWIKEGNFEVETTTRDKDGNVVVRKFPVEVSHKCLVDPEGARVRGA
jgi:4-methylaminobutanoate oxidase (formaldehyde-forming)